MSEQIVEFAKPLLDAVGPSPSVREVQVVMMIATVAWNLPVYERDDPVFARTCRLMLDELWSLAPPEMHLLADLLMRERLARFGTDPRLVEVEVETGADGRPLIVAIAPERRTPPER